MTTKKLHSSDTTPNSSPQPEDQDLIRLSQAQMASRQINSLNHLLVRTDLKSQRVTNAALKMRNSLPPYSGSTQ